MEMHFIASPIDDVYRATGVVTGTEVVRVKKMRMTVVSFFIKCFYLNVKENILSSNCIRLKFKSSINLKLSGVKT